MLLASLCDKLISGKKDSQRETASLGLKSVVGDLSASNLASFTFTVPSLVLPKLKQGLQAKVWEVRRSSRFLALLMKTVGSK